MKKEHYFQIIIFLLLISLWTLIFLFHEEIAKLKELGYLGAFLSSILTNATILIPAPGWAVIAFLATILNPWLVGLLAGLGAVIGQMTGYFLGYSGRFIIKKDNPRHQKITNWMQKHGSLTIFLFALIPNPFSDIPGAIAGISKFPILKFILFCTLGNIPKHLFFALVGGWGLEYLL